MRSSDWSSDVCSSDLRAERRVKRVELQLQAIGQPHLDTVAKTQLLDRRGGDIDALLVQLGKFGRHEIERALSQKRDLGTLTIGRASGREGVVSTCMSRGLMYH